MCYTSFMSLKSQIREDLKTALKSGDQEKTGVIRFLFAQIQNVEIDQGKKELTDEQLVTLIQKQVKKTNDSLQMFKKGQREDLVTKAETEIKILESYLPEQISDEELGKAVDEIISQNENLKDNLGALIGKAVAELKDQAEGSRIAQMVREKLIN